MSLCFRGSVPLLVSFFGKQPPGSFPGHFAALWGHPPPDAEVSKRGASRHGGGQLDHVHQHDQCHPGPTFFREKMGGGGGGEMGTLLGGSQPSPAPFSFLVFGGSFHLTHQK